MPETDPSKLPELETFSGLLSDRVYQSLRTAILKMDFAPGDIIRKSLICERLGVSRSPVSEALSKLANEGLVDVIPQSATRVTKLSMQTIREETFIREALEVAMVARAAELRTDEQLGKLQRNIRMQSMVVEDNDLLEFHRYDEEFHALLVACTGFTRLTSTIESLSLQVQRARLMLLPEPGRVADTVDEHQAILDAVRSGDPAKSQDAMRLHLRQLMKRLVPLEKERPDIFTQ